MKRRHAVIGWANALVLALLVGFSHGPPAAAADVTATIDLSETTASGPGYVVSGSAPAYSNPNFAAAPDRTVEFNTDANGLVYRITQSWVRATPPSTQAPKQGTSIFLDIVVRDHVKVTFIVNEIDLPGTIRLGDGAGATILLDGASYVRNRITVPDGAALRIDSLNGNDTTDRLTLPSSTSQTAAMIGGSGGPSGTITIDGGGIDITARATGAGIGGAGTSSSTQNGYSGGVTTINGGTISVTQYGGSNGAGAAIGGGAGSGSLVTGASTGHGGVITINGGRITVVQRGNGAGIGGGYHGLAGDITINGGTVDADSTMGEAAAIGCGSGTIPPGPNNITINGGVVNARGNTGAGIGNTNGGVPVMITITGGDVFATGTSASGIGGLFGYDDVITISGGSVVAQSKSRSGIGNGATSSNLCISSTASVTGVSGGTQPAIAGKDNACDGTYVNATLNAALSTTASATLSAYSIDAGTPFSTSLTLPADWRSFGYSTESTGSRTTNVVAAVSGGTLGIIVRNADLSPKIYSIDSNVQYNPHNGGAGNGVLPVRLVSIAPGQPAVTDIAFTSALFHSTGQLLPTTGDYLAGGFLYSSTGAVDASGRLVDAADMPWAGFSPDEITAPVQDLSPGTTYYLQTYLSTKRGDFVSLVLPFTTRAISVIDLSTTTDSGDGFTVSGVKEGDEYPTRFPAADGQIDAPTGVLDFAADADGQTFTVTQSGVSASPDAGEPKHGTSIFAQINVVDADVTLIVDSIDLIGSIRVQGTGKLTLLLAQDSFVHGSIAVPVGTSLIIDESVSGSSVSVFASATTPDAAGIGGYVDGESSGSITIAGGTVTAVGSQNGAAVGGAARGTANVTITGGHVTATGRAGAGIGGGFGGSSAMVTIGAGVVKAYSAFDTPGGKRAIDADSPGILGSAYIVGAVLQAPLSATDPVDILVFPDGYSAGDPGARIDTLRLPAGLTAFAYTTGDTSRTDNLYADLGFSDGLRRVDYRAIDRVEDNSKAAYSVKDTDLYDQNNPAGATGSGVLQMKLRLPPVAGDPSAGWVGRRDADLTSTGQLLNGNTFVDGGFRYSTTLGAAMRRDTTGAVEMSWGLTALDDNPITRQATGLTPGTTYFVTTYVTAVVDLYLDAPSAEQTYQSLTVAEFTTLPAPAFTFRKVDEAGQPMAGAVFALFTCDSGNTAACDTVDAQLVTSDDAGLVTFDAATGRYLLVEKETQPGYQLPKGGWLVMVDSEATTPVTITASPDDPLSPPPAFRAQPDGSLELPNYRKIEMPLLGGLGVLPWSIGGVALLGLGVLYALSPTRKEDRLGG